MSHPYQKRPTPESGPEWMSTAEVAQYLGVTPRTLYRFIDEGLIAGFRLGRVIRCKKPDVEAFLEDCRVEPGTLAHLYPETLARQNDEE